MKFKFKNVSETIAKKLNYVKKKVYSTYFEKKFENSISWVYNDIIKTKHTTYSKL